MSRLITFETFKQHLKTDVEFIEELTANRPECSKQTSPSETSDLPKGTDHEAAEEQKFLDCHYNFLPTVTTRSGSEQLLKCLTNKFFAGSKRTDGLQIADEWCRLEKRLEFDHLRGVIVPSEVFEVSGFGLISSFLRVEMQIRCVI